MALAAAGFVSAAGKSMTQRPEKAAVSCDTEGTAVLDQVCPILIETLNDSYGAKALFVADDGATAAGLHVRLETTLASKSMLKGRLHWRYGRDGADTPEPEVTLAVSDGELTGATIENFARALVKVSDLPIGE